MAISQFDSPSENSWCPGCGNFGILGSLKSALEAENLKPQDVLMVSGIGQAAKLPHYMNANGFNGLHGRALPAALGAQAANRSLKIIVATGDGDALAEGGNHFMHNIRRNLDLVHLLHDNQVYGLTKGQASPTTPLGQITTLQTSGVRVVPINPTTIAIASHCTFVARSFSGDPAHLKKMIQLALQHKGYALIDILQPCPSFNKVNTLKWYKENIFHLDDSYDPHDKVKAFEMSLKWGEETGIPVGVLYQESRPTFLDQYPHISETPLVFKNRSPLDIQSVLDGMTQK